MNKTMDLSNLRIDYEKSILHKSDMRLNPLDQFEAWLKEAKDENIRDFNAMSLATADSDGHVGIRIILLKELTKSGFIFFTNYNSRKGKDLSDNPHAALNFYWDRLERQINIKGIVKKTTRATSESYFHGRPRNSQLAAWASSQSDALPGGYIELLDKYRYYEALYKDQTVPLPPHWGGYCLVPTALSFWQGKPSRLHDRIDYKKNGTHWDIQRVSP